jgi:RNA polymerase sigma-70 factor (ECF subfamily)
VKDGRAAEDVVQEAFVNIWRMAGSYTTARGTVGAWAMTVVRNRAVDHLRRLNARPQIASDLENVVVATAHDEVWTLVTQSLDAETIRKAMRSLPPEQRETIEMGFFQGLSHQEIADRKGLPLGTVKSRMRNGLKKMRANLAGEEKRTSAR